MKITHNELVKIISEEINRLDSNKALDEEFIKKMADKVKNFFGFGSGDKQQDTSPLSGRKTIPQSPKGSPQALANIPEVKPFLDRLEKTQSAKQRKAMLANLINNVVIPELYTMNVAIQDKNVSSQIENIYNIFRKANSSLLNLQLPANAQITPDYQRTAASKGAFTAAAPTIQKKVSEPAASPVGKATPEKSPAAKPGAFTRSKGTHDPVAITPDRATPDEIAADRKKAGGTKNEASDRKSSISVKLK